MKKFYSFVLLAVTLLLSTNIWAESEVVTVGDKSFTSLNGDDGAIATWIKDGGTLTLLENCQYDATATATIAKDATLDLNGKALTWNASSFNPVDVNGGVSFTIHGNASNRGSLNFVCSSSSFSPVAINIAKDGDVVSQITIENADVVSDFVNARGTLLKGGKGGIYHIENVVFEAKNNVKAVLQINDTNNDAIIGKDIFQNITVKYSGVATKAGAVSAFEIGIRNCTLEDCSVKFAGVLSSASCYALKSFSGSSIFTIKGSKTNFDCNNGNSNSATMCSYSSSSGRETIDVQEGVFSAPLILGSANKDIKITIGESVKLSTMPAYVPSLYGKSFEKIGGEDEYKDYYKISDKAIYKFVNRTTFVPFENASECFEKAGSGNNICILTESTEENDFEIPVNTNITLSEKSDNSYKGTITNRGTLSLSSANAGWNNIRIPVGGINSEHI